MTQKTQKTQIVIGSIVDQPAITLRESSAWVEFRNGAPVDKDSSAMGRVLAAFHAVPDLLLAGAVAGKKLMEVEIYGDLTRAADGVGYRAFAVGDHGIQEHARLFDLDSLNTLVDVAAVWRVASVVVAQKYLHDINQNLTEIKSTVGAIGKFQRDEQRSKIESSYEYLFQVEKSLAAGERSIAVRHRMEDIEAEMDSIQRHLKKLFDERLGSRVAHDEMFGVDKLTKDLAAKAEDVDRIVHDYMLAAMTRLGALQMVAFFPDQKALIQARAERVRQSTENAPAMCEAYAGSLSKEIDGMKTKWEPVETLMIEIATGCTPVHKWIDKLTSSLPKNGSMASRNFRGEDGSMTPRLDAVKKAFQKWLVTRSELAKKRAIGVAVACERVKRLLQDQPVRYLVEWGDGGPIRIMEAKSG